MEPARFTESRRVIQNGAPDRAQPPTASTAGRNNEFGQPIGPELAGWKPPPTPHRATLKGQFCQLEPLSADAHGRSLFDAFAADAHGRNWTYMPYGPFNDYADFRRWLDGACAADDPLFFAIADAASGTAAGVASYLNIDTANGSIEVGHIHYSEALKQTRAATEAMYLLMKQAFDLGYRRYEWKCDALNRPSRAAARRLGFRFEGLFRNAVVYNGRSRDSAWHSIIDSEWPRLDAAFRTWLDKDNFAADGHQRRSLSALTAPHATAIVTVVGSR
jgi:RimJ/RimL family protein N-acetyltransferase